MTRDNSPSDDDQLVPLRPAETNGDEGARPRTAGSKKAGSSTRLLIGLLGGGLMIIALMTLAIYVHGRKPRNVYLQARDDMGNERFDLLWDVLDITSREEMRRWAADMEAWAAKNNGKAFNGSGKQAFIRWMGAVTKTRKTRDPTESTVTVVSEEIDGDRAVLTVEETKAGGRKSTWTIPMVKEDGRWRLPLAGLR